MKKDVLLMYSGGYDSILSACLLAEAGYNVHLVHFKPIGYIESSNITVEEGVNLIFKDYYLKDRIFNLGSFDIKQFQAGIKLDLFNYYNTTLKDIERLYPNLIYCDFNCLVCRSGMYNLAIELAKYYGFGYIAEGARTSQIFSIEQLEMIKKYSMLCKENNLTLLTPVLNLESDIKRQSQLYKRNINLRCEGKCLLGFKMEETNEDIVKSAVDFYEDEIYPILKNNLLDKLGSKSLKLNK